MKEELLNDIRDLAESAELREVIFSLTEQWIGTKVTDASSTLSKFITDTLFREFDFAQSFQDQIRKEILDENQQTPHVYVRTGTKAHDTWYNLSKQYDRIEIKFSKNFSGYQEPVEIGTFDISDFSAVKFENENAINFDTLNEENDEPNKYGQLEIEIHGISTRVSLTAIGKTTDQKLISPSKMFKMKDLTNALSPTKEKRKVIGSCMIPLSEAFRVNELAHEWTISQRSEKMGCMSLVFAFRNQNFPTLKDKLSQLIVGKILDDLKNLQDDAILYASKLGTKYKNKLDFIPADPFDYDPVIKKSKHYVQHFIEIYSEQNVGRKKPLELFYNNINIGNICSMLQNGSRIKCPQVVSITKDVIEIQNTDEEPCNNKIVKIDSISWESGKKFSLLNVPLRLELRAEIISSTNKQIDTIIAARKLLHLLYFVEASAAKFSENKLLSWDGSLRSNSKNILTMLRPCCSHNQWRAMSSWTILGIRMLFPDIVDQRIVHDHLKTILDEIGDSKYPEETYGFKFASNSRFSIEEYKKACVKNICRYQNVDSREVDEAEVLTYVIDSLQLMHHYDNTEIKALLHTQLSNCVKEKIAQNIQATELHPVENIQNLLYLVNSYDKKLQDIQLRYGNFAVEVWCPVLAFNIIDKMLPRTTEFLGSIQSIGDSDTKEVMENTIEIYLKVKSLFRFGQTSEFHEAENTFFKVFEPWLLPWLNHIEKKAKVQIATAVNEHIQKSFNTSPSKTPLARVRSSELGFLDEIEGAKSVVDIIQSIIYPKMGVKPWKDIFCPFHKKGEHGFQFLEMIHRLFMYYVQLLEDGVLADEEFDRSELANIWMSMFHVKYQYLNDFYTKEISMTDKERIYVPKVEQMRADVMRKAYFFTDLFCSHQKKYFKMYLHNEDTASLTSDQYWNVNSENTISGHIEDLLKFFQDKWTTYFTINEDLKSASEGGKQSFKYFISKLFELEELVIKEHFEGLQKKKRTSMDPKAYKQLLETIESSMIFRRKNDIEESEILNNIYTDLELKSSSSLQLISKHLKILHEAQSKQPENSGGVRFIVGLVGNNIHVHLKNVDLTPRDDKDTCNFKIKVSLLPIQSCDSTFCIKKSTPVYHEKKTVIFELEDPTNTSSYRFIFDMAADSIQTEDSELTQFIELSLYDISSAKELFSRVVKYFRGHVLLPLNEEIRTFHSIEEFEEHSHTGQQIEAKFVFSESVDCINDRKNENIHPSNRLAYDHLRLREDIKKDDIARGYIKHRKNQYKNCWTKTKVE